VKLGQGPHEYKGTLVIPPMLPWQKSQITFMGRTGGKSMSPNIAMDVGLHVTRYRLFRAKRWRSPSEFHEAQAAFYMLKFR
jgi:hypothetical protein